MKHKCCRRDFLKTGAVAAAGVACCGALTSQAFAQGKDEETEVVAILGEYKKLATSEPELVKASFEDSEGRIVEEEKVYVRWVKINDYSSTWVVVSAICQHLKCKVNWEGDKSRFVCPCHGSEYDINGSKVKGPTKRDLPDYSDDVFLEGSQVKLRRTIQTEE